MSVGETVVVVLAGGRGARVGAVTNKVLLELAGVPILVRSVSAFTAHPGIDRVLVVGHVEDLERIDILLCKYLPQQRIEVVAGGAQRPDSERAALDVLREDIERGVVSTVLIHDGARPLVTPALIGAVIEAGQRYGGAVPGVEVTGLLDASTQELRPVEARVTVRVQTPQGFSARPLLAAYDAAGSVGFVGTDTAAYLELYGGVRVRVVPGDPANLKVTWPGDLAAAEALLRGS